MLIPKVSWKLALDLSDWPCSSLTLQSLLQYTQQLMGDLLSTAQPGIRLLHYMLQVADMIQASYDLAGDCNVVGLECSQYFSGV